MTNQLFREHLNTPTKPKPLFNKGGQLKPGLTQIRNHGPKPEPLHKLGRTTKYQTKG